MIRQLLKKFFNWIVGSTVYSNTQFSNLNTAAGDKKMSFCAFKAEVFVNVYFLIFKLKIVLIYSQ